jgi:hypothetical protein
VPLAGNLSVNEHLTKSSFLAREKLKGPVSLVFYDGFLFTGLANGQLVRIDGQGSVSKVAQTGDSTDENSCGKIFLTLLFFLNFFFLISYFLLNP